MNLQLPTEYKHQSDAIAKTIEYFSDNSNKRGKIIMPCGSGKSLTSFWAMQQMRLLKNIKRTIITIPNLILQGQIFKTFYSSLSETHSFICIGSNKDVSSGFENNETTVTTCESEIKSFLQLNKDKHIVVIATYQSLVKFSEICKEINFSFNFGIIDEAHRTVGTKNKFFSTILFDEEIKIDRRLFMTATEKVFSKKDDMVIGMDNIDYYGNTIYEYKLPQAVKDGILCDYQVATIVSTSDEITEFINSNKYINSIELDLSPSDYKKMMSSVLATITAIREKGCRKIVTYHTTIKKAKIFKSLLDAVITNNLLDVGVFHVNGKQNSKDRIKNMLGFEKSNIAVLTNSQALVEGIDVPCIDCIVYADKKDGAIGIIQSVGRSLRIFKGKTESYIVIPVLAESIEDIDIENSEFSGLFNILMTLGIMDERVLHEIKYFNIEGNNSSEDKKISTIINTEIDEKFKYKINQLIDKVFLNVHNRADWKPFLSYEEASIWVQTNELTKKIKTSGEWKKNAYKLPSFIPKNPDSYYKKRGEWRMWNVFLSTKKRIRVGDYLPYDELKKWVCGSEFSYIKSISEWKKISKKLPIFAPTDIKTVYERHGTWISYDDFFNRIQEKKLSYEDAKKWVKTNPLTCDIKSRAEWKIKTNILPPFIPKSPKEYYTSRGSWINWEDFLDRDGFLSYEEAKKWVQTNSLTSDIKSNREWKRKTNILPLFIPKAPDSYYKIIKEWKSWMDFLGK
jgi:superfamily II DNA or RNA helicase